MPSTAAGPGTSHAAGVLFAFSPSHRRRSMATWACCRRCSRGFGMDIKKVSGREHYQFAVPSLFLVDTTGRVRWAHADASDSGRDRRGEALNQRGVPTRGCAGLRVRRSNQARKRHERLPDHARAGGPPRPLAAATAGDSRLAHWIICYWRVVLASCRSPRPTVLNRRGPGFGSS